MSEHESAYDLWALVVVNSAVFILFAFSFARPRTGRDWRSFGGFSAFIVALFAEMYGFPLTIYLLSGWLGSRYPGLLTLTHDSGHLWWTLLGAKGNPHVHPIHLASSLLNVGGLILVASAWRVLYEAQRTRTLAIGGPYAHVRHPQYVGFVLIMLGFLIQWPTLPTSIMFPILVVTYVRLAHVEEAEVVAAFGTAYLRYAERTPAFRPRLGRALERERGTP